MKSQNIPFVFETKVEITKHPFRLQGVGGLLLYFFYTKRITSRYRMRTPAYVVYMSQLIR